MFSVNDTVSYGTHGVCKIIGVKKLKLVKETEEYYILKHLYKDVSKIYVPIKNEALTSKMRRVLSKDEINELIRVMPDNEIIWIENDNERREKYQEILESGNRKEIAALIKTLYQRKNEYKDRKRRLRQSDELILTRAQALLYDEFALVLNIKPEQVIPFLRRKIEIETLKKTEQP